MSSLKILFVEEEEEESEQERLTYPPGTTPPPRDYPASFPLLPFLGQNGRAVLRHLAVAVLLVECFALCN